MGVLTMRHFCQVAAGVDVGPLVWALHRQPGLWNQHTARTRGDTPHLAVDDIWVRFRDPVELTDAAAFAETFSPVMYPAWHALPPLRPLIFALMARLEAVQLGGVLITRVPPGCQVAPHDDRGRWHPEFFTMKVYLPLLTNPQCYNECMDERIYMKVGDAWTFDNLLTHATVNDGATDRVTLIVSLRCE
jgi:hypothetical protein